MVLVGNKIDMENKREVYKDDGQFLACRFNCSFIEITAKLKTHIEQFKFFKNKLKELIFSF
jgi:hypothetical protein